MRRGGALGIVGASYSKVCTVWLPAEFQTPIAYGHVQVHMGHNGQGDMPNTGKPYGGCTKGHTFPAISRSTEFFSETFLK